MRLQTLDSIKLPDLSIRIMDAALRGFGLDPAPCYDAADLAPGMTSLAPGLVTGRQEIRFQRALVRLTGFRPDIWVRIGRRYRAVGYGNLGLAMMTAPTLRHLLKFGARSHFTYSLARSRPIEVDGQIIGQEMDTSPVPDDIREFTVLRDFAAISALYDDLWRAPFPFRHISLAVRAPPMPVANQLGREVIFGANKTSWYWRASIADVPLFHGDSVLYEAFSRGFIQTVEARLANDDLLEDLYRVLGRLDQDQLSLRTAARAMNLSIRTLQRRLDQRGIRFRGLIDEFRKRRALEMLLSTDTPVSQIAWMTGYSDLASFDHAFRRWTGKSPSSFRETRAGNPRPATLA